MGRWRIYGGGSSFFGLMYDTAQEIFPHYVKNINNGLLHIGDEMISTLAIRRLKNKGVQFYDAGILGYIKRYWGMHESTPLKSSELIFGHLLIDKIWIAQNIDSIISFSRERFIKSYTRHWRIYRLLNQTRAVFKSLMGK